MARTRKIADLAPPADPAETLAWEQEHRRPAAIAAAVAGILTLAGGLYQVVFLGDAPNVGVIQAMTPALDGQVDVSPSPRTAFAQFLADHFGQLVIAGVLTAVGALASGYALWFLMRATMARRPEVPAFARWVIVVGSVTFGLFSLLLSLFQGIGAKNYIDGASRTRDAVDTALSGTPIELSLILAYVGRLSLGLAFVLVCINAMRAGLLTRFMGILGCLVGALFVIPLVSLPIVQSFWLVALVPLFLAQWPNGTPRAWLSGKAEPWPSSAEVREQRMAAQKAKKAGHDDVFEDAVDRGAIDEGGAEPAPVPRTNAARRRRKRR